MKNKNFEIMDVTLRDGSYAINFQFSTNDEKNICASLEKQGIRYIEIGHGMGVGASNLKNGLALHTDKEYLRCAQDNLSVAKYGMFCIPGIASLDDVEMMAEYGCSFIRIGTNVESINQSEEYIKHAKKYHMHVMANYMKSYAATPEEFSEAVKRSEAWGADLIYIVDSAGNMVPDDIARYYEAIRSCSDKLEVGFHGHDNIGLALSNSLFAAELGINFIDCSLQGMGRSSGNACLEHFLICLSRLGYDVPLDIISLLLDSKKHIYPFIKKSGINPIDTICGVSGFHTSYLKEIQKCSIKYGVNPLLLIEAYSKRDKVNLNRDLMNEIAKQLPKDAQSVETVDFMDYFGGEQCR
ncbi:MAG: 4-hydroxy-2-oxovalerate aldolase [Lachnospiraceae bacterium]|nr:4-hydroxy-2-oxovalerate aldolase [Lachnospiraceae bacterium]MCM1237840.1 4-hydroxy-2-oxovalerate aldolase [Lachnospiraceae bacterium]